MWLLDDVEVARPDAIVSGREFAHIHEDGSLHAPLPLARALEVAEKGWGERHPWAELRPGWDGFVMLFTPLSMEELEVTFQLIVDSYNHVTGRELDAATLMSGDAAGIGASDSQDDPSADSEEAAVDSQHASPRDDEANTARDDDKSE